MRRSGVALCLLPVLLVGCISKLDGNHAYIPTPQASLDGTEDEAVRAEAMEAYRSSLAANRRLVGDGEEGGAVFTTVDLDEKPRVVYQPEPAYTAELRKRAPGTVHIVFIVDGTGRVESLYVQDSTDPVFEAPAMAAVKKWRFEPGRRHGQPVRVRMRIPITFTTRGSETDEEAAEAWDETSLAGGSSRLTAEELELWNDPDFQARFTESYIAETEVEPRVTSEEREQMEKVLELISSDRMDRAAALLEKHRDATSSAVFDFTLANIHFQRDELDEAVAVYQIAVEKYPKFRRAWRNLGMIYVRQGEFEKAIPALIRVIELGGGDAVTYGLLGFAYGNRENSLSAESAYRMAILTDPETMDWQMGLARSLFRQERYADAVAHCERMIAADPNRADLWLLQANAYIGLNQPLRAAENYELVDRMGKSTADSLNMLGDIYTNEELYGLAVDSYIRAFELDSQSSPQRALRAAKVLTAHGALHETRRLVEQIEVHRGDQLEVEDQKDLLKLRARIAVAEGAGDEEARVLEEIVELDPLDGEALILLGQHAERSGDLEKAVFYFERAAGLEDFEADAKVRHAQLLVKQGKYAAALPLLRRAQQLKPRDNIQRYLEQVERVAKSR